MASARGDRGCSLEIVVVGEGTAATSPTAATEHLEREQLELGTRMGL